MKKLSVLLAGLAVCCFASPAFAAPVFPDVPEEHWARDAVANLAASGLVEGYPDGTFKGNRAATRYEMAMVIARFLAKNDQEHATFATKADLEELRRLVNQLKSELDALGVRVTNLEDSVASLDKRVTELERITFYGELDAIFTTQGFKSDQKWRVFNGYGWCEQGANIPEKITGAISGANAHPAIDGYMPVIDYKNGRPLTSGTGVSAVAKLGINAKVSDDVDAGLEIEAYTAIGDPIVNAFYGVSHPHTFMGLSNYAETREVGNFENVCTEAKLENFWVKHKPSGIKLTVGEFHEMNMDSILFAGVPDPNVNGHSYLNNLGFKVNGTANFLSDMDWEVFFTSLPDSDLTGLQTENIVNRRVSPTSDGGYNTYAYGLDLGWRFKGGNFKLGYLRAMNDGNNYTGSNTSAGITQSGLQWGSPFEYINGYNTHLAPVFNTADGISIFGEQSTTNWSAHFDYTWEDSKIKPRFFAEYAHSDYKPTHESDYSVSGSALRAGLGATFFDDTLDVDIQYKSIEPTYDPMILRYPIAVNSMWRLPNFSYFPGMYQLHDSEIYTNNRQGWDFKLTYRFKDDRGKIWASYQTYQQVETGLCKTADNNLNYYYKPGFIDAFFSPCVGSNVPVYDLAGNVVGINTYDDHKGKTSKFDIGVDYKFKNDLGLELNYYKQNFKRDTDLRINQLYFINTGYAGYTPGLYDFGTSAAQNYVDLDVSGFHVGVSYPFNEKFTGKVGFDYTSIKGHYDPNMLHYNYAIQRNSYDYTNIDTKQSVPYIGFDYKLSKNTEWSCNFKYFSTVDDALVCVPYPAVRDICAYNMDWSGTQFTTEFKVKF